MNRIETDYHDAPTADFASTGKRIFIGDTLATARVTRLYVPSARAQEWDGVKASHALGSRHGGFTYANVTVTGRGDLYPSGYGIVRKLRVEIGIGPGCLPEDREVVDAWLIDGGDSLEAAA